MPRFGAYTVPYLKVLSGAGHYLRLPALTTTQRDALTAAAGMLVYNSTTGQVEEYNGSTWRSVGQAILTTHAAVVDVHNRSLFTTPLVGSYPLGLPWLGYLGAAILVNYLYFRLYHVPRKMTFDRIAMHVYGAGGAGGKIRLGIYNASSLFLPSSLVLDAGTIDADSATFQAITINKQLDKGFYFMAFVHNASSNPSIAGGRASWSPMGFTQAVFNDIVEAGYNKGFTYDVLPDPAPTGLTISTGGPNVLLRVASLD